MSFLDDLKHVIEKGASDIKHVAEDIDGFSEPHDGNAAAPMSDRCAGNNDTLSAILRSRVVSAR